MNLGINTASIDISMELNRGIVLVVFPDAERAAWYMENCYEYYTRVVVVSMDGVYPYHHALKENVCKLWADPDTNCVVFGSWCIQGIEPRGTVFSLDKWAVELCRKRSSTVHNSIASLDWVRDPIMLARMIEVFANSRSRGAHINMSSVKESNYDWNHLPPTLRHLIEP